MRAAVLPLQLLPALLDYPAQAWQQDNPTPLELFDVVWNSDISLHCRALNRSLPLAANGIRANDGQAWFGDVIATLYGAGGSMPWVHANGSAVNGGIPQLADKAAIRAATRALLKQSVPSDFAGLGVFDIEYPKLYPLWAYDFGPADQIVRRLAANYTAAQNPQLRGVALQNRTIVDFNRGMTALWELQLQTAAELYPNARFGYYRMPHCWYSDADPFAPCNGNTADGDALGWLWNATGGVFPGAYFSSGNDANATARLISTVREAVRVAQVHGHGKPSVVPFVSYNMAIVEARKTINCCQQR